MPKILIVDDEPIDREHAERRLAEIEDLEVIFATDGEEALARIESDDPDLVLTDLRMPRMDGIDLVEQIRDDHPLVPVILMTSHGSETIAVKALSAGAASYVPKDDLKRSLKETVCQVLDVARARRSRKSVLRFLERSESRFLIDNDPDLIVPLVGFFQDSLERLAFGSPSTRTHVGMALMEAISNAIIHGNLEVSSELRREDRDAYYALIEARRVAEPYASRRVTCTVSESAEQVVYRIADEGGGFDLSALPDPTAPENMIKASGRGILLIRTFMDEVDYNDKGNEVTLTMRNPLL